MNQWIIRGRLTKEVEVKLHNETRVATFNLAFNNYYKNEAHFFEFKAFGKLAEVVSNLHKGNHVLVTATVRNNIYLDPETQKTIYGKDQYIVQSIEFLDSKVKTEEAEQLVQELPAAELNDIEYSNYEVSDEDGLY